MITPSMVLSEVVPTGGRPPFWEHLHELSAAILEVEDLDATLELVAERTAGIVNAENVAVGLIDREKRQFSFVSGFGNLMDETLGVVFPISKNSKWTAIETGEAAVFNDLPHALGADGKNPNLLGLKHAMLAPMKLNGVAIGLLAAGNSLSDRRFSGDDLWFFSILANHAAVAVRNAQLYGGMRAAVRKADAEKSKLEAILQNLGDGVVVCDAAGRVIMANEAAEVITGVNPQEVIGRAPTRMLPKVCANEVMAAFRGLARSKREDAMFREMVVTLKTGRTVRMNLHPVFSTEGAFFGTAALLQDVTKAVQIDQAKTEFISIVAHELRTPLTALKGSIGLVLGGASGDDQTTLADLLGIAQNNCNRLIRLVDDMLDIAKVEADRFSLRLEVGTIQDCVRSVVTQMHGLAEKQGVTLTVNVIGKPSAVVIDRDRIAQVVTNLLSNAIKFSPAGSEVVVVVKRVHGYVRVSVADAGPGIPREEQQKVFEKFYQGEAARRIGGSGLGLAISKAIVGQHGGKMYVAGPKRHGCVFAFLIPVPGEEALMTVRE